MKRLFPGLGTLRFGPINLDREARRRLDELGTPPEERNPLLDPGTCLAFVRDCHRRYGLDASYGGWLEDRRALWRGSYLDEDHRYLHLGIDVNVPAGTSIALPRRSAVVRVDDDHPEPYGWGSRLILRPEGMETVLILAHLSPDIRIGPGDTLEAGELVGRVGDHPRNGGWFPHLHVQLVELRHFEILLANGLRDLDGYGLPEDGDRLAVQFPNPTLLFADG